MKTIVSQLAYGVVGEILIFLEDGIIDKLKDLLKYNSQNDIELHVAEVRKTGNRIKINSKEFSLSDFGSFKNEILEEIKEANYHDIEDLVYRMQLAYDENMDILDIKCFLSKRTGFTLSKGVYRISDNNKALKNFLPDIVKVSITNDDVRLRSNLSINQTLIFTKRSIFYTILGFIQSYPEPLGDIDGYILINSRIIKR